MNLSDAIKLLKGDGGGFSYKPDYFSGGRWSAFLRYWEGEGKVFPSVFVEALETEQDDVVYALVGRYTNNDWF